MRSSLSIRAARVVSAALLAALFVPALPASAFQASVSANTIAAGNYRGTGANTSTTLVLTTTVAAPAGAVVVVSGATNNTGTDLPTVTVSDSASNTYTTRLQGCGGPTTAASGVCGFVATTTVGAELAIGATITVTLSAASARIAANAQFFTGVAEVFRSTSTNKTDTVTPTTAPSVTSGTVNSGDIVIGVLAVEDGSNAYVADSDTTNGTWSANTLSATSNGGGLTEVTAATQYKTVTAAGAQTFNGTSVSTDFWGATLVLNRMATPEAVTNLAATPQNTQVALTWTAAASNDSPITDYVVEYKTSASPTWLTFADGTSAATSATVTGLVNGTSYDFRITGVNAIGTSDIAAPTTTSTPRTVPSAPSGVAASPTASDKSMAITWTASTSNGGAAISGYTAVDQNGTTVCTSAASTTCTATGLTSSSSYRFRVYATNVAGDSGFSAESADTLQTSTPNAPQSLLVVSGRYRFILDWAAPVDNGFAITGYTATATAGATTRTCTTTTATRCIITGLPTSQSNYSITVRATNTYGSGASSASVSMPTWFTPAPPSAADLRSMDLAGLDLSYVNFTGADLSGVSLVGSNLTGAYIRSANLQGTDFTGTTLTALVSSLNTGTPAALPAAAVYTVGAIVAPSVNLSWQDLTGASLPGASLSSVNFSRANLSNANLSGADLTGANLASANLTSATLQGANLTGATITGATVQDTTLAPSSTTRLRSGSLSGTPSSLPTGGAVVNGFLLAPRVYLVGANLSGVSASGVDLTGANLQNANLQNASLTSLIAPTASFLGATMTNADLTGASLVAANLQNASLAGANLTSASAVSAKFTGANLTAATVSSASFISADFTNADLDAVVFSAANLTNAYLNGSSLEGSDLSSANITRLRSRSVSGTPTLPAASKMVDGYVVAPNVSLNAANLTGHDLRNLNLTGVLFVGATLHGTRFDGSTVTRANFSGQVNLATSFANVVGRPTVLPTGHRWVNNQLVKS